MQIGRVLISQEEIESRVRELGSEISADYAGRNPILISLLKGGFVFLADLIRHITIPHEVDFITVHSYRDGCTRSERIEILNDLKRSVSERDVIIIDGIVDTGHTLSFLEHMLSDRRVRSLRVCALLDKPACRQIKVPVDYVGFRVPDVFVVGYGLDFMELYRNLSYIAELIPTHAVDHASAEVSLAMPAIKPKNASVERMPALEAGRLAETDRKTARPVAKRDP